MTAKTSEMVVGNVVPMVRSTGAFEPNSIEEAYRLAKILVASKMLPRHLSSPEAAFAVIAAGRELGLTALQSTRSIYFVDGKVTLSADLMVALVKRHPDCEYFSVTEATNDKVTCVTKRRGEEPTTMTWTMADAQRAKLTGKANWASYPKAMLRARVSADLCRAVYPDAFMGIYETDELVREPAFAGTGSPGGVSINMDPPPAPERLPAHNPETGEVVDATFSPEDDAAELASGFAARIFTCQSTKELLDLRQEIKKAELGPELTLPLSEQFARRKKELAAAAP